MFRSKDAVKRWRRRDKKYNPNKEKNTRRVDRDEKCMTYGWQKGVQQVLRKEHGVKVQKSEMHNMTQRKWVGERWFDDKGTGNSTHRAIADLASAIATKEEYPLESNVVHDMTRWKKSKKRTKRRNAERRFKHDALHG
jgi:hypothetical protein